MNYKNFFILIFLFFIKIFITKSDTCKVGYVDIDSAYENINCDFELKDNVGINDIKNDILVIKSDIFKYKSKNFKDVTEPNCACIVYLKKNIDGEFRDIIKIIKENEKLNLAAEKPISINFKFITNKSYGNIKKCKIKKVKILNTIFDLTTPINISDFLQYVIIPDGTSSLAKQIFNHIKTSNLKNKIEVDEKAFGKKTNIEVGELLNNIERTSNEEIRVKNGKNEYYFTEDDSEDLILDLSSLGVKRQVNIKFEIPKDYILDAGASNTFKLDLHIHNFTTDGILKDLTTSIKEYFNNLINECKKKDTNFKATCDLYGLDYHFNSSECEPIDPKKYTLKNTTNTLEIKEAKDINETNIFNLTDNSTIEIEVGERCELLKTMIAEIEFKPLEGTELNGELTKKTHEILLNLKDSSLENLKKQIADYFKSKKVEGCYIPEDFYEQILNSDGFYVDGTHDHFELSINFNEKAKGSFLKETGAPDPDLEYFKNYIEEEGKPINPPQYIPPQPPVQEQTDTPKIDKNTGKCAQCCGKCLKCSNCNKKDN